MEGEQDGWVRADAWCKLHGERMNTLRVRVHAGTWQRGVHWSAPDGRGVSYVHQARCEEWMANKSKPKQ